MADILLRYVGPDGVPTQESAAQILCRVLVPVGNSYVTLIQALADRPTQGDVAAALQNAAIGAVDLSDLRSGIDAAHAAADAAQAALAAALPNGMPRAVRRSQLLRAVSTTLPGGLAAFLDAGLVSANPDDASSLAYFHEPFALPGGVLAGLLTAYCQTTLGMSAGAAAVQVAALFALAATLTPST